MYGPLKNAQTKPLISQDLDAVVPCRLKFRT